MYIVYEETLPYSGELMPRRVLVWYHTPTWVYAQFISVYITVEGSTIKAPAKLRNAAKFRNAAMFSYMHNNIIYI